MYFDDLQVSHNRSAILEENHYYSYGLKIASISSQRLSFNSSGAINNGYLYQGDFAELDDDIGWTDFALRNYDAQIGRWVQRDPYDQFASGYEGMGNNPVMMIDQSGGVSLPFSGGMSQTAATAITLGEVIVSAAPRVTATTTLSLTSLAVRASVNLTINVTTLTVGSVNNRIDHAAHLQEKDGYKHYQSIPERQLFYQWYAVKEIDRGSDVNWAGAAALIAKQMSFVLMYRTAIAAYIGTKNTVDLIAFANEGNQAIFEDVFARLRENRNAPPKKGAEAVKWDAKTLLREQFEVVHPIYEKWVKKNPELKTILQDLATQSGDFWFIDWIQLPKEFKFEGDIMKPLDRYNHGMYKMVPLWKGLFKPN